MKYVFEIEGTHPDLDSGMVSRSIHQWAEGQAELMSRFPRAWRVLAPAFRALKRADALVYTAEDMATATANVELTFDEGADKAAIRTAVLSIQQFARTEFGRD